MLKEKIDFKLVNLALIVFVVFIAHQTGSFWYGIAATIFGLIFPLFIAFAIAYALNPFVKWLESKGLNKKLSVLTLTITILTLITILFSIIFPLLFSQFTGLLNSIIEFVKEITNSLDVEIGPIQETIVLNINEIIKSISSYVSDGAIKTLGMSMSFLTLGLIVFSIALYFLYDFEKIRELIKEYLKRKNKRAFIYTKLLDKEFRSYLTGLMKVMVITYFEYTIAFLIIGHDHALLLGFLAAFANLIPYFGGLATNVIANITAFVISPALFLRTIILSLILSAVDSFIINPAVYGKSNQIHPIIVIFSVYAGGSLLGPLGIFLALPTAILLISGYKFFKEDIQEKLKIR
jgi:predicted PurR-regulated permease PerM